MDELEERFLKGEYTPFEEAPTLTPLELPPKKRKGTVLPFHIVFCPCNNYISPYCRNEQRKYSSAEKERERSTTCKEDVYEEKWYV